MILEDEDFAVSEGYEATMAKGGIGRWTITERGKGDKAGGRISHNSILKKVKKRWDNLLEEPEHLRETLQRHTGTDGKGEAQEIQKYEEQPHTLNIESLTATGVTYNEYIQGRTGNVPTQFT